MAVAIVLIALAILGYMLEDPATSNSPHAREQRGKERKLRKEKWLEQVTDRKLEFELEDMMCLHPEDIVLRYGKSVYTKKQRENIAAAHRETVQRVMMANRGKLMWHDAWSGIPSWGFGAPTTLMCHEWE